VAGCQVGLATPACADHAIYDNFPEIPLTSVQLPVPFKNPLYSCTYFPAMPSSVTRSTISPSGPTTIGDTAVLFPPDMKKKKAVINSIEPIFGRGGGPGGAMKTGRAAPGGTVGTAAKEVSPVGRGERGEGGAPSGGGGGPGVDMA